MRSVLARSMVGAQPIDRPAPLRLGRGLCRPPIGLHGARIQNVQQQDAVVSEQRPTDWKAVAVSYRWPLVVICLGLVGLFFHETDEQKEKRLELLRTSKDDAVTQKQIDHQLVNMNGASFARVVVPTGRTNLRVK